MKYGIIEGFRYSGVNYGLSSTAGRASLPELVRSLGLHGLEVSIGTDFLEDSLWSGTSNERWRLRDLAKTNEVEICSVCLHMLNQSQHSLASPNPVEREHAAEIIIHATKVCQELGAKILLLPFFETANIGTAEQEQSVVSALHELARIALRSSVSLGLETSLEAKKIVSMIGRVGSPLVGVYYDVGNSSRLGYDVAQEIKLIGSSILQIHMKDDPPICPLGEGRVDLRAVFRSLRAIDFGGYVIMETPYTFNSVIEAERNLSYLVSLEGSFEVTNS